MKLTITPRHSLIFKFAPVFIFSMPSVARQDGFKLPMTRVHRESGQTYRNSFTTQASLKNGGEIAYMVNITIGAQELPVIMDTGSSDLWVVSSQCSNSDCNNVRRYQYLTGSLIPSHEKFHLNYLSGSVSGDINFETVVVGPYEISHQVFALANDTKNLGMSATGNSGIMGLCFGPAASIPPTSGGTLMDNLFASLPETNRFFAFKLGRDGTNDTGSSLTFGQIDTEYAQSLDDLTYHTVSKAGTSDYNFWKIPLQSITVNSIPFELSPSLVPGAKSPIAVLDTGTTLILAPTADVDAFYEVAGYGGSARKDPFSGMWETHCNRSITVGLILGDKGSEKEYVIHPRDMSWAEGGQQADGWCLGGIQANDGVNSGDWLLGDTFLRNVYAVHRGASSTQPPLIGLLNLTDPITAAAEFTAERGGYADSSQTPNSLPVHSSQAQSSSDPVTSYLASSLCGFMGGAVMTTLFRARALILTKGFNSI